MRHLGPIAGIASHGTMVATAGYDNRVILWEAGSGTAVALGHHDHLVNHCAFSADGRWLVSASSDYSARVWELPALRLHAVLRGHGDDVDMAVFAPDNRRIATCALDRLVRIFDRDGTCQHVMSGHTGNVLSLAWSSDGRQLVSSSVDGTLRWWDTERGAPTRVANLQVRTDSVELASDGTAYAGDDRGRIAIVDADGVQTLQAHRAGIKKIALDERRGLLITLSYDRTMAVWRLCPGGAAPRAVELARCALPPTVWARAATLLSDGRVAVGTFGSTYATFDLNTACWDVRGVAAGPALNAVLQVGGHVYAVGDSGRVQIDGRDGPDMGSLCNFLVAAGDRVFSGGQLGQLYDAHTGAVLHEHHSPLNCAVAFEKHGVPHLALGTYTGEILILTLDRSGAAAKVAELGVYENAVKGLSVSEGMLFSVCASTDIAWHRIEDWSLLQRVCKAHERIANACIALGRGHFASIGRDRVLRLWRGQSSDAYPSDHPNSVKCMAIDDERTVVLSGSYGGTLGLFDLADRRWRALSRPTHAGISSVCWDARHRRFLAASYDGRIYAVAP